MLCASLLTCTLLQAQNGDTQIAQDKDIEKAKQEITDYAYADAIETYEKMVEEGYADARIFKNLGKAHYMNANYREAAGWYTKLFSLEDAEIDSDDMYRYAQTLKSNGEYTASQEWMQKFEAATGDDLRARKYADNLDYLEEIARQSGRYNLKNLAINSAASDFAPAFNGENLVFSTARDTGAATRKIHGWNNQPFLNLYRTTEDESGQLSHPTKLSKNLNKKTHESSTAFTKDGSTMYFTRNNSQNGKFSRDNDGVSRLKIYRAVLRDGEWKHITELPFNSDAHSTAHPTLNHDETKLYFASDREGSLGQSDIFVVDILSDGGYGTPKNLGTGINTEARETFPFVTASGILYFASDGHPGLGGLDIFAVQLDAKKKGEILNVGKPVNSSQDDFSYIIDEESKKGFFASNREGGIGSDDIYGFTENKELRFFRETVIENPVKEVETVKPAPIGADLFKHLELRPILFDSDKAEVRPDAAGILAEIFTYMEEYPEIKIEVRSHTDAVGDADYNLRLSDQRVQNTVAFLISKGIDASRLSGKGYGETELINDCTMASSCSAAQHQENRRSEFVVVK